MRRPRSSDFAVVLEALNIQVQALVMLYASVKKDT